MDHILSFAILISFQLLFFIIQVLLFGQTNNILKYLGRGMLLGLPFGIMFDALVGNIAGMFTYYLGFGLLFLTFNGILSYGFMMANVNLLQKFSLLQVYLWSVVIGALYELVNYFYPVWQWTFASNVMVQEIVVICGAYFGLTILMMICLRIVFGTKFRALPF